MPERGVKRLLGDALPPQVGAAGAQAELYLVVDEPSEYYARALRAGARSLSVLARRDWGHEVAYCFTSDSHVLAFARPPA